jgi:hypothetical protein
VSVDNHILISLEPRHAENILEGRKRVELCRRTMNVTIGSMSGCTPSCRLIRSSVERSLRLSMC